MSRSVQVEVDEVRRVFDLLGRMNALFHQPLHYEDPQVVERFAQDNYSEISKLYYQVVWKWLPQDVQEEIMEG